MNGYSLFRFYLSLKLHFGQESYDVFEHTQSKPIPFSTFEKRKDRMLFERLAKKLKDDREGVRFLVANHAYGNPQMIWTDWDISQDNMIKWNKAKQSLSKIFTDDLDYLVNKGSTQLNCTENEISVIIKEWKAGKINIETVCLICQLEPALISSWKSIDSLNSKYGTDFLRIQKLIPFVKMNETISGVWHEF